MDEKEMDAGGFEGGASGALGGDLSHLPLPPLPSNLLTAPEALD